MARKWKPIAIVFLLLLLVVCLLTVTGGYLALKGDSITRQDYDSIHFGMTLPEVEALFGSPGGGVEKDIKRIAPDRKTVEMVEEGPFDNRPDDNVPGRRLVWVSRDTTVMIRLGKDNRVTDKMFHRLEPPAYYQCVQYYFFKKT